MQDEDRSLIQAFQAGDDFAFVSIYNRHKSAVYTFCVKMLLDKEAAQDVLQETFLRVYENRNRLLNAGSFRAWLFTIARNQCLNVLRRERRRVPLDPEDESMVAFEEASSSMLETSEQIDRVNEFLSRLKDEYREVLVLREYQNLSYEEIAAITRSTLSAVKSRLFKARRRLAAMQDDEERVSVRVLKSPTGSRIIDP